MSELIALADTETRALWKGLRLGYSESMGHPLLRSEIRPTTKLIVVNSPHSPTGMMLDRTTYDGIIEIAQEGGIRLVMDEVYRGLEFDETDRLAAGADALPGGISIGVMSKAYAMAGLRIGWVATQDRDLLARLAAFKDYTTICSSAPSEI